MAVTFDPPLALLVSLPRNDVELARAAVDHGADALKVHVNVGHRASGTRFRSVAEEAPALREVIDLGVPVGLVVGGEGEVDRDEVRAARELGFAFFDVYLHHAPSWYVAEAPERGAMVAIAHDADPTVVAELPALGVAAVEASLAAPEDYGSPMHLGRLAEIARLRRLTDLPLVVPTQHAITPEDVPALHRLGVDGLLIGAVVTGTDATGVATATSGFRSAIDALDGTTRSSASSAAGRTASSTASRTSSTTARTTVSSSTGTTRTDGEGAP